MSDGSTRSAELQQKLRTTFMIRRLKQDVLPELPPKRRQLIVLDEEIDWSQHPDFRRWHELWKSSYEASVARLEAARTLEEYRRAVRELETVSIPFEQTSDCRHQTGLLKLPGCLRYTDLLLDSGLDCAVIFAHHIDVIDKIHDHYGRESCIIHGDTDQEDRMPIVREFQSGRYRILIAGLKAAGVGITLTRSSTGIFYETDWNPATIVQGEDRMHRYGQKKMVQSHFPVLNGSLDANMIQKILKKQDMVDKILNPQPEAQLSRPPAKS